MADSVVEVLLESASVVEVFQGIPGTPGADADGGGAVESVNGATGVVVLVKSDVGLGSVDNTADADKPVSTAQAAALAEKLDTTAAPELIRDTVGATLVAGTNVTITPNDAGDTITISASGGASAPEVRHSSDATYSYMGNAADGTAEGSSGWTVTRITLTSPPVVETGSGTWTGRAGLSYS